MAIGVMSGGAPHRGIAVEDVSFGYGTASSDVTLSGLSFGVKRGTFITVVGPSGCGKTTLLMLIAGLLRPVSGQIRIGDSVVEGPQPNIVFQDSTLLPWRTVLRNVALPLEVAGIGRQERLERAREALRLVALERYADYYPGQLSGGMRQRVSLARGVVTEPSVLLMDEPFAALDEQTRYEMGAELLRVWDRLKTTVVFITHSLSEAIFLSDEVIALGGSPGQIRDRFEVHFERPRSLDLMGTAEFAALRGRLYNTLRKDQSVGEDQGQSAGAAIGYDGLNPDLRDITTLASFAERGKDHRNG
jgi:NitT/TauT family transport system ATP-binding protein